MIPEDPAPRVTTDAPGKLYLLGEYAVVEPGRQAVLVAVELALQSGRVSAEHVLNVLSRLQEQRISEPPVATMLTLSTPPQANLQRYDALRNALPLEASQESDHA